MFILPFEHATQELVASKIIPRFVFCPQQMFLDCRLRTNSRMIHARQPKNFKPLHSRASRKNVLDGVVRTWPSVSTPVMFGGGITIENGGFDEIGFATKSRLSIQSAYHFGSTDFGS